MFTKREYQYFDVARSVAKLSNHYKARIGAVIVKNGDIIASAFNINKSHPIQAKYNRLRKIENKNTIQHCLHAEIGAIIKSPVEKLYQASIFVNRISINNSEKMLMCKPCAACMQAIIDFSISDVYYMSELGPIHQEIW